MAETWYTEHARIDELIIPGKRLGRHVRHDSRSLGYPWPRTGQPVVSRLWARHTEILDQDGYGSCTGEATVGALGTDPLFDTLTAAQQALLTQDEALKIYSEAEIIDGGAGLPSEDSGSSGLSVAQAAKNDGFISGYLNCASVSDVLDALQSANLIIGSNWYSSMDSPDSSGLVGISPGAYVRGGHEYLCRGVDAGSRLVICDNSWGTGFGVKGSFSYTWDTLAQLLAEQGDATVFVPVTQPAPVPVPPDTDTTDVTFAREITQWALERHGFGKTARAAQSARTWLHARGFI